MYLTNNKSGFGQIKESKIQTDSSLGQWEWIEAAIGGVAKAAVGITGVALQYRSAREQREAEEAAARLAAEADREAREIAQQTAQQVHEQRMAELEAERIALQARREESARAAEAEAKAAERARKAAAAALIEQRGVSPILLVVLGVGGVAGAGMIVWALTKKKK